MSTPDLVLHAPRAVLGAGRSEEPVTVSVADGVVTDVRPLDRSVTGTEVVVLGDDEVLLPGLVDTHVHVNEPGRTEWEGFSTATRAAAAGGVTTILDMPLNSLPPTLDPDALAVKRSAAEGKCAVDVGFWGGAVPANLGSLGPLLEAGVFGVKCFLADSGVEEFPPLSTADLLRAGEEIAAHDGLLLVHAEDPGELSAAPDPSGPSYARFLASRPATSEVAAVATVLDVARHTGARVHVVHLSSAGALPLLAGAKADGVRVSVETCPHYLVLRAEDVPDGATDYKCCPPVRDDANRDALWAGLGDGTIDMVVSDHSPCIPALKALDTGDFAAAWGGISSLQLGLPLVWTEARRRGHDLADVVRWMSHAPAAFAGLRTKGSVRAGFAADLVVLAPDEEMVVDPATLHHRHAVTPYAGARLTGVVRRTWLAGAPVTPDRTPAGRLLARGEA
ncbi:MAG: allantoinase AllB [Spirochaetaceae bacterium]|nr:allantoinase AllB [Spirochaetaceae bacterium]